MLNLLKLFPTEKELDEGVFEGLLEKHSEIAKAGDALILDFAEKYNSPIILVPESNIKFVRISKQKEGASNEN